MGGNIRMALVIGGIILLIASTLGVIFSLLPTDKVDEPQLAVDLYVRPQIITAAYKIYGDPGMTMWAARTIIKNTGKVPVRDFRISY